MNTEILNSVLEEIEILKNRHKHILKYKRNEALTFELNKLITIFLQRIEEIKSEQ